MSSCILKHYISFTLYFHTWGFKLEKWIIYFSLCFDGELQMFDFPVNDISCISLSILPSGFPVWLHNSLGHFRHVPITELGNEMYFLWYCTRGPSAAIICQCLLQVIITISLHPSRQIIHVNLSGICNC